MKIGPVGAGLFLADGQTDGRTDMKKANSRFWEFCERGKKKGIVRINPNTLSA